MEQAFFDQPICKLMPEEEKKEDTFGQVIGTFFFGVGLVFWNALAIYGLFKLFMR